MGKRSATAQVFMLDYIKERCELVHTYAEDGAYGSAARVLRQLAYEVQEHAESIGKMLQEIQGSDANGH